MNAQLRRRALAQRGTGVLVVLTAGRVIVHPAAVRAVKLAAVCKSVGYRVAQVHGGDIVRLLVESRVRAGQ